MFYRLSGTYHTSYEADRRLWKIPTDRWLVIGLLVLALLAPLYVSPLYLGSYVLPWVIWSAAALSLSVRSGAFAAIAVTQAFVASSTGVPNSA